MNYSNILSAVLVLGILGAALGVVLAFASRIFAVKTDQKVEDIATALPGANCGACGYAGCSGFAAAVAAGEAPVNGCKAGGQAVAQKLAHIMGVAASESKPQVALVRCSGGDRATKKFSYYGLSDCIAASKVGGNGPLDCAYGCLGFGTCVKACAFGAISVENGVARVDRDKCTGCLACVSACPRKIIVPVPCDAGAVVACSSKEKGAVLKTICEIGCIGCRLCEKKCPSGAITVADNLASIDYAKCTRCGLCVSVCPRKLISDTALKCETTNAG